LTPSASGLICARADRQRGGRSQRPEQRNDRSDMHQMTARAGVCQCESGQHGQCAAEVGGQQRGPAAGECERTQPER